RNTCWGDFFINKTLGLHGRRRISLGQVTFVITSSHGSPRVDFGGGMSLLLIGSKSSYDLRSLQLTYQTLFSRCRMPNACQVSWPNHSLSEFDLLLIYYITSFLGGEKKVNLNKNSFRR
ncbi:hypothetical protein X777_12582, partial [Ooceraea biroi]